MHLFVPVLLLLLFSARLLGEVFKRLGQAPLIGEVLAGVLLGPSVLMLVDPSPATDAGSLLAVVAALGVFFLVLAAGIEVGREGLRQALQEGTFIVAATEFVFPFSLGYVLGFALGLDFLGALFLGTALAVTALPVSVRILMDLELLHTSLGRTIVSVAVVNDVLAFALLGLVVELSTASAAGSALPVDALLLGIGKILVFVALLYAVGWLLLRKSSARGGQPHLALLIAKLRAPESPMAVVLLLALALGAASEMLGLHFAVGVFYAGIFMTREAIGDGRFLLVRNAAFAVSLGLLAPVFFAFVGLNVSLSLGNWPLIILVTSVAFVGKVVGGLIGGALAGFRGRLLAAVGVGLNARGMMELLLAQVGLASGIIGQDLYSAIVIMTLVTTLSTPPLLKLLLRGESQERANNEKA